MILTSWEWNPTVDYSGIVLGDNNGTVERYYIQFS